MPNLIEQRLRPLGVVAVAVLAALALAVTGCGGKSDSEQITETYTEFVKEVRSQNWDGMCRRFSNRAHEQIRQLAAALQVTSCPAVMAQQYAANPQSPLINPAAGEPEVTDTKVNGKKATANVKPSADANPETNFVLEGKTWKIDADDQPAAEKTDKSTTDKSTTDKSTTDESTTEKSTTESK